MIEKLEQPQNGVVWNVTSIENKKSWLNTNDTVPDELLEEILKNDELFAYCIDRFVNNKNLVFYIQSSKSSRRIVTFEKLPMIKEFKKMYQSDLRKDKIQSIIATSEYSFYEKNIQNSTISIGNKKIKIKNIIDILNKPFKRDDFIKQLKNLKISINEFMNCLCDSPINLSKTQRNQGKTILDGYNFPSKMREQILENVRYLAENSNLYNRIDDSDVYVYKIVDFFQDHNIEEYIKNNNDILGYSFPQIASIINEFIFNKIGYEKCDGKITYNTTIAELELVVRNKLFKFMEKYIPELLSQKEFQTDTYFINVEINDELENRILSEIPQEYTDLQKVYYIYKFLCANFVYDPYFLAGSQREKYDINNHRDIQNVKNINMQNNQVVCYDISLILAKLIEKLGHPVQLVNYKGTQLREYGKEHMAVKAKVGDYYLELDIADGLVHNDMTNQHLTGQVQNFVISNQYRNEVQEKLGQVDTDFNAKYNSCEKYKEALKKYEEQYAKDTKVGFGEKIDIVLSSLSNENKMEDTIKLLHVKNIINLLFGENNNKCSVAFIGSRGNTGDRNKIALGCILACNENGLVSLYNTNSDSAGNRYYFFPNLQLEKDEIQPITKGKIENMIKNKDIIGITQLIRY